MKRKKKIHIALVSLMFCVTTLLGAGQSAQAASVKKPVILNPVVSDQTSRLQVLGYEGTTLVVQCGKETLVQESYRKDGVKTVSLKPQKAGKKVTVYLKGADGGKSSTLTREVKKVAGEKVKKSVKRPKVLTKSITSKTKKVKVKGYKGTKLVVKNQRLKTIKTVKFRKNGTKTVKIPAQKDGTALYFYLKAGKKRGPVVRKAVKDVTAPAAPEVTKKAKGSVLVKGELGAAVYLKNTKGKFVWAGFITSKSGITLKDAVLKNGTCSVALEDTAGNRSKTTKLKPLKFSLTIGEELPSFDSMYRTTRACVFNADTGKLKTIASIEQNAQYTLTYCDGKSDYIYYVTNPDEDRWDGDQLYSYNIKTKKSKQLTDSLYAINAIVPMKGNKLFLAAVADGTHTVSPMCYDISTGKLKNLSWDPDLFVKRVARDPQTGTIYIVGFSNSENEKKLEEMREEKISKYGIDNTIYSITPDGKHKAVYVSKKRFIDFFVINGNRVLCCTRIKDMSDEYLIGEPITKMVNLKTGKETVMTKESYLDWEIDYLDNSGRYLYMDDGERIFKRDLKTKKDTVLYTIDVGDDYLNNVRLIP